MKDVFQVGMLNFLERQYSHKIFRKIKEKNNFNNILLLYLIVLQFNDFFFFYK